MCCLYVDGGILGRLIKGVDLIRIKDYNMDLANKKSFLKKELKKLKLPNVSDGFLGATDWKVCGGSHWI